VLRERVNDNEDDNDNDNNNNNHLKSSIFFAVRQV
jgi:hypothetical protein